MSLVIFLIRLSQQDITVIPVRRPSTKEHRRKKQIKLFFILFLSSYLKRPSTRDIQISTPKTSQRVNKIIYINLGLFMDAKEMCINPKTVRNHLKKLL